MCKSHKIPESSQKFAEFANSSSIGPTIPHECHDLKNVVIYKGTKWEKGCNVIWNNLFGEGWNENSEILFENAFSLCVLEWDVLRTQKSE